MFKLNPAENKKKAANAPEKPSIEMLSHPWLQTWVPLYFWPIMFYTVNLALGRRTLFPLFKNKDGKKS